MNMSGPDPNPHGVDPVRTYLAVFGALMGFTALTVAAAFWDIGHHTPAGWPNVFNDLLAMTIALSKALLVITFFMHVRHATRLTKVVVSSSFAFLLILMAFTLSDYFTRGWLGPPGK